jgi:hypothetical protein
MHVGPVTGHPVTQQRTTDESTRSAAVRLRDAFAHRPYPYADSEKCRVCMLQATHKVGEYTTQDRHEFTAYLCCEHFGAIMGRVARHWCAGEWPAQP